MGAVIQITKADFTEDPYLDGLAVASVAASYNTQESATPLAPGDSAAGTATITVAGVAKSRAEQVFDRGLILEDQDRGTLRGTLVDVALSPAGDGLAVYTATSLMNALNKDVTTRPQFNNNSSSSDGPGHTTLMAALTYYCGLAGLTVNVDPRISWRPFLAPGFTGNLWDHLRQLCAAYGIEMYNAGTSVGFTLPGQVELSVLSPAELQINQTSTERAKAVSLINQNLNPVTGSGYLWKSDEVYSDLASGELREIKVTFDGSPLAVQQPVCTTYPTGMNAALAPFSQYMVQGGDGFNVSAAAWNANGGNIKVAIDPDVPNGLIITIQAAYLPARAPFKISEGEDQPALWVSGIGVLYTPEDVVIPTGDSTAPQDLFEVPENVFLGNQQQVFDRGIHSSQQHSGPRMTMSINGALKLYLERKGYRDYSYGGVNLLKEQIAHPGPLQGSTAGWRTFREWNLRISPDGLLYRDEGSVPAGTIFLEGRDFRTYNYAVREDAANTDIWSFPVLEGQSYTLAYRVISTGATVRPVIVWDTGAPSTGANIATGTSSTGYMTVTVPPFVTSGYVAFQAVTTGNMNFVVQDLALVQGSSFTLPAEAPLVPAVELTNWYGNLPGSVLTYRNHKWRVITASYTSTDVSLVLERCTTMSDFGEAWSGSTLSALDAVWAGATLTQFDTAPLKREAN